MYVYIYIYMYIYIYVYIYVYIYIYHAGVRYPWYCIAMYRKVFFLFIVIVYLRYELKKLLVMHKT